MEVATQVRKLLKTVPQNAGTIFFFSAQRGLILCQQIY